jgi:hypothetical protein
MEQGGRTILKRKARKLFMPPSGPPPVRASLPPSYKKEQHDQALEHNRVLQRRIKDLQRQLARLRGLLIKATEAAKP